MGYIDKAKEIKSKPKTSIASMVVELMDASNKLHILHLTVKGPGSYAAHQALGELYNALPDFADGLAEGYQGVTGTLLEYPSVTVSPMNSVKEALSYIDTLYGKVTNLQESLPYSEIVNDLDTLKSKLNSTKYKLTFLA